MSCCINLSTNCFLNHQRCAIRNRFRTLNAADCRIHCLHTAREICVRQRSIINNTIKHITKSKPRGAGREAELSKVVVGTLESCREFANMLMINRVTYKRGKFLDYPSNYQLLKKILRAVCTNDRYHGPTIRPFPSNSVLPHVATATGLESGLRTDFRQAICVLCWASADKGNDKVPVHSMKAYGERRHSSTDS